MNTELGRLATFHNWAKFSIVTPEKLAKAGFFFVGPWDRVQCAFCYGKLEKWVLGDEPAHEHKKHFGSRCKFIRGESTANVVDIKIYPTTAAAAAVTTTTTTVERVEDKVLRCKICLDEDINILFLPCSHLVCCNFCCNALIKCPICRQPINECLRVYQP